MTNHEDEEDNQTFTEDVKEVLEFNKARRKPANGAETPSPNLGKLGDLMQKKAEKIKEEADAAVEGEVEGQVEGQVDRQEDETS